MTLENPLNILAEALHACELAGYEVGSVADNVMADAAAGLSFELEFFVFDAMELSVYFDTTVPEFVVSVQSLKPDQQGYILAAALQLNHVHESPTLRYSLDPINQAITLTDRIVLIQGNPEELALLISDLTVRMVNLSVVRPDHQLAPGPIDESTANMIEAPDIQALMRMDLLRG